MIKPLTELQRRFYDILCYALRIEMKQNDEFKKFINNATVDELNEVIDLFSKTAQTQIKVNDNT